MRFRFLGLIILLLLAGCTQFLPNHSSPQVKQDSFQLSKRSVFTRIIVENFILKSSHSGRLPPNIAKVDGLEPLILYRSGLVKAEFIPSLVQMGIRSIVTLNRVSPETRKAIQYARIHHREFGFFSTQMTLEGIKQAIQAIYDTPKPVLVHCHAGADRTGIVIACLRILNGERDREKLFAEMGNYGHITFKRYEYYYKLMSDYITYAEQFTLNSEILKKK
ncbi:MAG: tyrosine-protein phosphatase [Desulfobacterales bacterium]|nr:tyrosine-protein phosphatase [Desulfobacterales bacterium]